MKHVERTKSGSWRYRRRVPKGISEIITKRDFKKKLGDSEREALAAYPRFHAQVEREIEAAKRGRARSVAPSKAALSEREAYAEALRRRADLIDAGATEEDLEITAEMLSDQYPQDEDGPLRCPQLTVTLST
ncbi:hypothetical protein [Pseudorhodobacter antarcticus]|uniref:hypothetical protein n=1 Tax=Pseudorhodobacter antarcticus TaxID=1077947 RepID=UPI0012E1A9D6|nr:hypothetical protein [Pseudorhodobacter antarcticus]